MNKLYGMKFLIPRSYKIYHFGLNPTVNLFLMALLNLPEEIDDVSKYFNSLRDLITKNGGLGNLSSENTIIRVSCFDTMKKSNNLQLLLGLLNLHISVDNSYEHYDSLVNCLKSLYAENGKAIEKAYRGASLELGMNQENLNIYLASEKTMAMRILTGFWETKNLLIPKDLLSYSDILHVEEMTLDNAYSTSDDEFQI